jgi:hypothetical protein
VLNEYSETVQLQFSVKTEVHVSKNCGVKPSVQGTVLSGEFVGTAIALRVELQKT